MRRSAGPGLHLLDRLAETGVLVVHHQWEGHLHGFRSDPATYDDADPALSGIAAALLRQATRR